MIIMINLFFDGAPPWWNTWSPCFGREGVKQLDGQKKQWVPVPILMGQHGLQGKQASTQQFPYLLPCLIS